MEIVNESQYRLFQKLLATNHTFRRFWQFWSNYAFVFFAFAFILVVTNINYQIIIILSAISFLVSRIFLVTLINLIYHKPRPYQKFEFIPITSRFFSWQTKLPNSFPSRHTTAYFAVASIVILYMPMLGLSLMIISLMAGIARVILGYHWPIDIIVGVLLGTAMGLLTSVVIVDFLFT